MTTAAESVDDQSADEIAFQLELCADSLRCLLRLAMDQVMRPLEEDGSIKLPSEARSNVFALDYAMRKVIDDIVSQAKTLANRE